MTISHWPVRRWIASVLAAAIVALFVGVPTGIIRTPFYTRMTPVLWWNYPVWAITAVLGGLIFATYVRSAAAPTKRQTNGSIGGSILSLLAVGCPICNKVVVALLGVSGALTVWAPVQRLLGAVSLVLLLWALHRRLAGERACAARPVGALPESSA
ncbi:MAG: hypothetical protein DLM56_08580 [Pseudonocardiales bacterium]|nr:MAG: hypothetical protein DLM56_08580 [Pseudonocardiales bacterium]